MTDSDDGDRGELSREDRLDELIVTPGLSIPASDLKWRFSTSSGPGGQHVNTSHTRAQVSVDLTAAVGLPDGVRAVLVDALGPTVTATAGDSRSQARNRELARTRLAAKLAAALQVSRPRKPTRPSKAAKRRRIESKRRRGEVKRGRRALPPED